MIVGIYQSLILLFVFHGTTANPASSVSINGNVEEEIGSDNMELKCNFTIAVGDALTGVKILATNNTTDDFRIVAAFTLVGPILTPFGKTIFGNVTLTKTESTAHLEFDNLTCKTERTYQCQISFQSTGTIGEGFKDSEKMNITVLVPPSKPNNISILQRTPDLLLTSVKYMEYSTSSQPTTPISKYQDTSSALQVMQQNDTTAFNNSTVLKTDHNTVSITPPNYDFSSKISYKATQYSTQQTPAAQGIAEGDNITVVCTGDVGKPPAKHVFRKLRNGQKIPIQGAVTTTSISEMSENCSYFRTTNLTFQVTAKDNNAMIRCVVNSSMTEAPAMYVETAPLKIYYEASIPNITIYPNKEYYVVGENTSIHLTCNSVGNPKPNYQWYKENNELISINESWTITEMNITSSGVYTCNVSNTFNGETYRNTKNVKIDIMNKADISTTQSSSTGGSSGADDNKKTFDVNKVIAIVAGVISFVIIVSLIALIAWKKRKSKSPTVKSVSKSLDDSKSIPITELRPDNYELIGFEDDHTKTLSGHDGLAVENIKEHNKAYWKQDEEEQKKNELNTPTKPAVYAQVNEATKTRNKQKPETPDNPDKREEDMYADTPEGIYDEAGNPQYKESENAEQFDSSTISRNAPPQPAVNTQVNETTWSKKKPQTKSTEKADKQEEYTYLESQEGINDKAGDRLHKENKDAEQFNSSTNSSNTSSNGDNKLSIQTSQIGSYVNREIQKDENRKVATVQPTIRSSSGSHYDEQTNINRNSQSKKGYENMIGIHQTGAKEEDVLHRTSL